MSTPASQRPPIPPVLTAAAKLRRDGRLDDARAALEMALTEARAGPADVPLRDRALICLGLVDLHVAANDKNQALHLLADELAHADAVLDATQRDGSEDQVRSTRLAWGQLKDRMAQVGILGETATEIGPVEWVNGTPTTLSKLQGRVVLIEFWGSSCRACLQTFPWLSNLHDRYEASGLTVLALSHYSFSADDLANRSQERELVSRIVVEQGLRIRVGIVSDSRLQFRYGARGIPSYTIIDRDGIVRIASSVPDKTRMENAIREFCGIVEGGSGDDGHKGT